MLGPAADELAEMWRDQVRLYRYERQLKCVEKAEKMAKDAGFTPQAVPPKILFPLLEGASFEEDENLHTMWAALLANSALPENAAQVRPGFIAILSQMAPDEAALLQAIAEITHEKPRTVEYRGDGQFVNSYRFPLVSLERRFAVLPGENVVSMNIRLHICLQLIVKSGLVEAGQDHLGCLMPLGEAFLNACRPPKPKA
jgi:hypothetical protein